MDIQIVIRKGTAYFLMSAIVATPYVVIIFGVSHFFEGYKVSDWILVAILLTLAGSLLPLWTLVQRQVDRWFYRERYDFLKALKQLSLETQSITGSKQVHLTFLQLIRQAMRASSCYLLLSSPLTGDFVMESSSNSGNSLPRLILSRDSPLTQYLENIKVCVRRIDLDVVPELLSLTAGERERLREINGELFLGLKSRGELIGILILSAKLSRQPYTREEEDLLTTITNQMAINLENAHLYDTEQRERARLEAILAQRNEFLLAISHELKTPLTSIKLSSEMLAEETKVMPESTEGKLLRNLHISANNMEKRVTDLLDFLKLQAYSLEFKPGKEDINMVLKDIISFISPLISAKQQTLDLEIPGHFTKVIIDRQRFEQVLINLLSNANKYTPTGGRIKLITAMNDRELTISVSDNGPGIPLDEQDLVFEPYYRVKGQSDRSLGLGLSIARSLVELHGGKIWISSTPGKGATFTFTIPVDGAVKEGNKPVFLTTKR